METWVKNPLTVHGGPIFTVLSGTVRLDDGSLEKREVVHHPGSVAVVAISGNKVLLTSQSRIAAEGREILEIPAGRINIAEKETPSDAALRELEEETGYTGDLESGPVYYSSVGFLDEVVHIFFALNAEKIPESKRRAQPDRDERIKLRWMPLGKIADDLKHHKFNDSKTIIGLREVLAVLDLNNQMIDDKSLYGFYSDENHKYNTLIWQFPVAIVGLNVLAVERLWSSSLLMIVLWFINNVLLLCVAKHVYHQRSFTKALESIADRFRTMHPHIPVVKFPREGVLLLTKLPVTWLLFWSLFLLNQVLLGVFFWLRR